MSEEPPRMFRLPTDPPEPLPPLRGGEQLTRLHTKWAQMHRTAPKTASFGDRVGSRAKSMFARVTRGSDLDFLGDLVRAVDEVAARCDELSERLNILTITADDLARSLGEEVTQLRAAVSCSASPGPDPPPEEPR